MSPPQLNLLLSSYCLLALVFLAQCQDYEVADVKCLQQKVAEPGSKQHMVARLRKPEGFRGSPLFADDLRVNPRTDIYCSILPDPSDPTARIYRLTITDFTRCGVTHHSGYVHVRIWFPLLPSAMTSHDQEVILVCKPPEATVISTKATEFASTSLGQARISGVVEESSYKLEYQVAIYRHTDVEYQQPLALNRHLIPPSVTTSSSSSPYLVPVDDAVPIGTRLQLRANINAQSAWKYVKLVEVTVSPDPKEAHAEGHVRLLHLGCRTPEMRSLMRTQARRVASRPTEVWLDFEAFLLSSNYSDYYSSGHLQPKGQRKVEGQQWIHTTVLACVEETDCRPDVCGDPVDPAGYGRRKRSTTSLNHSELQFGNKVPIRIIVPNEENGSSEGSTDDCRVWIVPLAILASTWISTLVCLFLAYRWNRQKKEMAGTGPNSSAYANHPVFHIRPVQQSNRK